MHNFYLPVVSRLFPSLFPIIVDEVWFASLLIIVSLLGAHIRKERNPDVLLIACKDIGLAARTEKTKYMEVGCRRGMMENEHIKMGSNSY